MINLSSWGEIFQITLTETWLKIVYLLPNIIGAILIFSLGLFFSRLLGRLAAKGIKKVYVDKAVEATGAKGALEKIGFKSEISSAFGLLITWSLYAVFLVAAADILGLTQISVFLSDIVLYIPNVIIAVVMLILGMIISGFVQVLVKETTLAANLASAELLSQAAKWAIVVFSIMAALIQLKVATELIQILFAGLVFSLSLASGIAFGLGGKDKAKEIIDQIFRK